MRHKTRLILKKCWKKYFGKNTLKKSFRKKIWTKYFGKKFFDTKKLIIKTYNTLNQCETRHNSTVPSCFVVSRGACLILLQLEYCMTKCCNSRARFQSVTTRWLEPNFSLTCEKKIWKKILITNINNTIYQCVGRKRNERVGFERHF